MAPVRSVDPALRESYALCRRVHATHRPTYLATRLLLPPSIRPHAHALVAFVAASDRVADVGELRVRERAFRRWSAASMDELRRGESRHPLRRALINTSRVHDLRPELFLRFLEATRADLTGTTEFPTFEDLRRFLRGVCGTAAVAGTRLMGRPDPELERLALLTGEVHHLIDIFCDYPEDLPQGRVYVAVEDMNRVGVDRATLRRGIPSRALDALVRQQVWRARSLHRESVGLVSLLPVHYRSFALAAMEIHVEYLDLVERMGSRVLRDRAAVSRPRLARLALPHLLFGGGRVRADSGRFPLLGRDSARGARPRHLAPVHDGWTVPPRGPLRKEDTP
ncbi:MULTISPECIES: phytoene/squalene synthase family protein [Actinoalloteichus]|nr:MULTISPECIES: squalene/phytoene synthase family protein [Actinoalloteichus]